MVERLNGQFVDPLKSHGLKPKSQMATACLTRYPINLKA
jgi:hypothetical protein